MLGADKIGKVRRAHFREGRSIKGISRDMTVSRAIVRKVLRSNGRQARNGSSPPPNRMSNDQNEQIYFRTLNCARYGMERFLAGPLA